MRIPCCVILSCAVRTHPGGGAVRATEHYRGSPSDRLTYKASLAAELMIWSIACMAKLKVMNSTIGSQSRQRPQPTAIPAKPCSVMGVSITRLCDPNSSNKPWLILCRHLDIHRPLRPSENTLSLPRISSAMASRNASRTVCCFHRRAFGPIWGGV